MYRWLQVIIIINNSTYSSTLKEHLTYLNNTIDMKTHDKLRDITHQIVKPVVNSRQNVNGFIIVSEKHSKEAWY